MVGELEAAGDLVTGAAVARVIEPVAGEHGGTAPHCLNCGAKLAGGHCHACGQKADVHRTIGAFWHDFTHSILHFEGKIWRTLPLLFFKPGELTRRYVHGERARFVSPLALFLFSVFLMFAVFSWVALPFDNEGGDLARVDRPDLAQIEQSLAKTRAELADVQARIARDGATPALEKRAVDLKSDVRSTEAARAIAQRLNGDERAAPVKVDTGYPAIDARIRHGLANPQLLLYKMQSNAYKFSWALVLLSLPFMWLAFAWRRQFHLFDHLVFVTYSLCFVSLLLVAAALLNAAGLGAITALLLIVGFPIHLYAQLRGAYSLSRLGALWRSIFLLASAFVVTLVFGLILLAIGAS